MVNKSKKQSKIDKGQPTLFDFGDFTEEEKIELQSHENHIEDSDKFKELDNNHDDNENNKEESNIRSEQIFINDKQFNNIFSNLCHYSNNLFNQCIFEIRQAFSDMSSSNKQVSSNEQR